MKALISRFWPYFAIVAVVLAYFPEVASLKQGFLSGDHRAQHFPWATFYAEQLRQGYFPWWTNAFQCGFPLLAEGQVGAFYLPNLAFYSLLPVIEAYSFGILFHFMLGGMFFYGYLRQRSLSVWAALFATLIYLFGTAQGGYYYNIISLKTLIWFPGALWLCDLYLQTQKKRYAILLGICFSLQFMAGYLQYALYSISFSLFYFLWFMIRDFKSTGRPERLFRNAVFLICAFFTGILFSLPQLGATWELAGFSNRFSFSEEFVYIGSFSPAALATIFFPHWDSFLRAELYVGAIGLYFLIWSLWTKKDPGEWFFLVFFIITLGLALGKFNPLFVALIKITHFYSFRTPSKFIYFAAFALAVLCGYGFQKWRSQSESGSGLNPGPFYILQTAGIAGIFLGHASLRIFSEPVKGFFRNYIQRHFADSEVHTKPMDEYLARFDGLYDYMIRSTGVLDKWNLIFLGFMLFSMVLVFFIHKPRNAARGWAVFGVFALLFSNLYAYGWTSVKGNYEQSSFLLGKSSIVEKIKTDQGIFRVHRAPKDVGSSDGFPFVPHTNMLFGAEMTGGYSPLLMKKMTDIVGLIGDSNDSQNFMPFRPGNLEEYTALVDFLNIKYVITEEPITRGSYRLIEEAGSHYLYLNPDRLPRAFFVSRSVAIPNGDFDAGALQGMEPTRRVYLTDGTESNDTEESEEIYLPAEIVKYESQFMNINLEVPMPGYLVVSKSFYPGWHALINGTDVPIHEANGAFSAVYLPEAGKHNIQIVYDPVWKRVTGLPFLGYAIGFLLLASLLLRRNERQIN